jgi:uncharacterized membrane protein YesL
MYRDLKERWGTDYRVLDGCIYCLVFLYCFKRIFYHNVSYARFLKPAFLHHSSAPHQLSPVFGY